jgi:hypothetical protein
MSAEGRRQAWAELAGIPITGTYNDTFMQFALSNGWLGAFPDRMIQYLRQITGNLSMNIPDLQRIVAVALGHSTWEEVGYDIKTLSGPIYGANVIVNGDFPVNVNGWAVYINGTVVWEAGRLKFQSGVPGAQGVFQNPFITPAPSGANVLLEADWEVIGWNPADTLRVLAGPGADNGSGFTHLLNPPTAAASGHISASFVMGATSNTLTFTPNNNFANFTLWLDNVSLRPYSLL